MDETNEVSIVSISVLPGGGLVVDSTEAYEGGRVGVKMGIVNKSRIVINAHYGTRTATESGYQTRERD
ncbi:hypothetical protein EVAR_38413_1 [Eumeta japonica]|uniref:Uncharacterized protein n=1 Tax=Eumeta variegata TaxID=151549 RepID=A0A4C1WWB1_EUMVA|nr:hypothetical protein EVAR_38413_1 [Eumeta japonica]